MIYPNGNAYTGDVYVNNYMVYHTNNLTNNLSTNYLSKWSGSTLVNSQVFDNGTNVSIGEQSSYVFFNVVGYTTYPVARFAQGSTWNDTNYALYVDGYSYLSGFRINGDDPQRGLYAKSNRQLGFATEAAAITFTTQASIERMRIAVNGNVGINTSSPVEKLDVNGNIVLSSSNGNRLSMYGKPGVSHIYDIRNDEVNALTIKSRYSEATPFSIDYQGNVGIGITNPNSKLTIIGGGLSIGQSDSLNWVTYLGNNGSNYET